ncbi:MAG: alkaline phosphatase family protein [Solirubrobacteraceae bacterium]
MSAGCEECGSPIAEDQRYCLVCGARAGARSALLEQLQQRILGGATPGATSAASPLAGAASPRTGGLRLPSPMISALLFAVFLGFGVLMGAAGGSRVGDTLAASSRRLNVVLPAAPANAFTAQSGEATPPTASEPEVPESEPTPTPEPAEAAPAKTTAFAVPAPAPAGAQSAPSKSGSGEAAAPATKLPPIKHVFVIMLSDQPYAAVFGPSSTAHYLAGTLEHRGTLLVRYDAVAHEELANEIALLSGQGPTVATAANCPSYTAIAPASPAATEQVLGEGCVYPAATQTLPGELAAKHLTWRAYMQGADEAGASAGACSHPAVGAADPSADQTLGAGPYATFANPFVYFAGIVDSPRCATDDVGLGSLKKDLASASSTANLTYIAPDRCHDGNATPCTAGASAGMAPANGFLEAVVPEILASKAYKQGGLLAITVDEAPSSGAFADSSRCCGQPSFPNLPAASPPTGLSPRGGGTVGALLLSPYLKGATTNQEPYNHFSLLKTFEDLFAVKHLGYAALPAVKPLEAAMFSSRKLP